MTHQTTSTPDVRPPSRPECPDPEALALPVRLRSDEIPSLIARRLATLLGEYGYDIGLGTCRELVAHMLGYRGRADLRRGLGLPGHGGDVDVDTFTREARRTHQVALLVAANIARGHAEMAVTALRPTDLYHPAPSGTWDAASLSEEAAPGNAPPGDRPRP